MNLCYLGAWTREAAEAEAEVEVEVEVVNQILLTCYYPSLSTSTFA
jgi:hypothetical protein